MYFMKLTLPAPSACIWRSSCWRTVWLRWHKRHLPCVILISMWCNLNIDHSFGRLSVWASEFVEADLIAACFSKHYQMQHLHQFLLWLHQYIDCNLHRALPILRLLRYDLDLLRAGRYNLHIVLRLGYFCMPLLLRSHTKQLRKWSWLRLI